MPGDKTVELLKVMRGPKQKGGGLKVVKVKTTDPDPVTFVFEGTALALDPDIFEIPVDMYPLRKGDRFLAYPLAGDDVSPRWGLVVKLNGGVVLATMKSPTSCRVEGIGRDYTATDLKIPPYFAVANTNSRYTDTNGPGTAYSAYYLEKDDIKPLAAGDVVSLAPTYVMEGDDVKIKYVILERY